MQKTKKTELPKAPVWNLSLLYKSPKDPQIEKDILEIERESEAFSKKYDTAQKAYLTDAKKLLPALTEYEKLIAKSPCKPILYFYYLRDLDSANGFAAAQMAKLSNRLTLSSSNKLAFFEISLGLIPVSRQKKLLADRKLAHFKVFLGRIFDDAQYTLSVPEEKIMNLKSLPAHGMWVAGNNRSLGELSVIWKNKTLPLSAAAQMIPSLLNPEERYRLHGLVMEKLKGASLFAEAEINAVMTDKKINDELRGFKTPYANTVTSYRNDPAVIEKLVDTVSGNFHVAHRFYVLKAKLLKLKKLKYADRAARVGTVSGTYTFDESVELLKRILRGIDEKYVRIFETYLKNRQIDVAPKVGKESGAYCSSSYGNPTFVLLNHTDDLHSFTTLAHEMGHAFHGELSEKQGALYCDYSYSLAETASTLFESIALEAIFDGLPEKEKITVLHDKIQDDIATIFRQIACFNFEKELHSAIRTKGFVSREEIADLHNKNMQAYLGPLFKIDRDDGFSFVTWSHIRRFFYVYSYAYGMLVTKALLRRYRADKIFWKSIEKFLAAGGSASPEEILADIGIDLSSSGFFKEGIAEIENDITKLEKLMR